MSFLGKSPSLKYGRLSSLPETSTICCRFNFVVVGCEAIDFTETLASAEESTRFNASHALLAAASCSEHGVPDGESGDGDGTEVVPIPTLGRRDSRRSLSMCSSNSGLSGVSSLSDRIGLYCCVDEEASQLVRVSLKSVSVFADSIPTYHDADSIRTGCTIFLISPSLEVEDQESVIRDRWFELRHNLERMPKKVKLINVAFIQDCAGGCPAQKPVEAYQPLIDQIRGYIGNRGLETDWFSADFHDSSQLYGVAQRICQSMYLRPDEGDDGNENRSSACCTSM